MLNFMKGLSEVLSFDYTRRDIWGRSQWPRGPRLRSSAALLLRLWVRIPPAAWMSDVSVVCCQVEVSAMS